MADYGTSYFILPHNTTQKALLSGSLFLFHFWEIILSRAMRRLKCHVEFCKHHTSAPLFKPRVNEALFSQITFVWKRIIIWGHMLLLLVLLISASVVELFYSRNLTASIARLSMAFTASGKRQKWNFCRLSSAVCTVEWNYLYLQWIVGDVIPFVCALFSD